MKRVELKRIAEVLWKGNSPDEKTPFATQGTVPDNGSFSKNLEAGDIKKPAKEFPGYEEEKSEAPMSIPRKICFVMSFNVWILYFLVLGWLLPCRNLECGSPYPDVVRKNLSSLRLLTNVETLNEKGLPSLAIFGFTNDTEQKLAALATFDGTFEWESDIPFISRKIQCNFENPFDSNGDGIPDCLLSGFSDVYAFNASNGHVFWHQRIPSEEGNILSLFHPTAMRDDGTSFLIGAYGDKLAVLDARNGTKVSAIGLPCYGPFEIKVVSNIHSGNFTLWNLVCDYGDKVEAWAFGEQEVLKRRKFEIKANDSEFALLFRGTNSGGSIDLRCDVTHVPGGPLLLSWSDRVAMVTPEATAWERHFPEPLAVASVKVGHFSDTDEFQVAAAVRNSTNTVVYILEMKNGSIVDSVTLDDRQIQSMEMITDDYDLLVLKSLMSNYTSQPVFNTYSNFLEPVIADQTNFVLIDFSSGAFSIKEIATTGSVADTDWTLNMQRNGQTDLLIFKTENDVLTYERHVLHDVDAPISILCIGSNNRHHYSFET